MNVWHCRASLSECMCRTYTSCMHMNCELGGYVFVKPGHWTVDWTMDCNLDGILDRIWLAECTSNDGWLFCVVDWTVFELENTTHAVRLITCLNTWWCMFLDLQSDFSTFNREVQSVLMAAASWWHNAGRLLQLHAPKHCVWLRTSSL